MSSRSDSQNQPPVEVEQPMVQKALVVECNYFALTTRIDPNVTFWDFYDAEVTQLYIPPNITLLWFDKDLPYEYRALLVNQARARNIRILSCPVKELCRHLLPVWAIPTNRSMVKPADPDGPGPKTEDDLLIEALLASDPAYAEFPALRKSSAWVSNTAKKRDDNESEPKTEGGLKLKDFLLRLAEKKARQERNKAKKGKTSVVKTNAVPVVHDYQRLKKELANLSVFEREIFSLYYSIDSTSDRAGDMRSTAFKFAISMETATEIIGRVWRKLRAAGVESKEEHLLAKRA
jgi:hypothetical protein